MRLLNVHTYTLREFSDEELETVHTYEPRDFSDEELEAEPGHSEEESSESVSKGYAILSHQWTRDEITFHRFPQILGQLNDVGDAPTWLDESNPKKISGEAASIYKLAGACALARERGYNYIWIDTVCIDKSSSAELSEAVNSMFRWYEKSSVCFVYLFGLHTKGRSEQQYLSDFEKNPWFTRGWTLQELLCPGDVEFCDHAWVRFGTKETLLQEIERAAHIDRGFIAMEVREACAWASIAQKMSWLSRRTTSKIEDMAYCMLGLFDINMSLLYGEREKAFMRLQRKILKESRDESIFVWETDDDRPCGLLAPHPICFRDSGNCICSPILSDWGRPRWAMTHRGLEFHIPSNSSSLMGLDEWGHATQMLELNCAKVHGQFDPPFEPKYWPRYQVKVGRRGRPVTEENWSRIEPDKLHLVSEGDMPDRPWLTCKNPTPRTIIVPQRTYFPSFKKSK